VNTDDGSNVKSVDVVGSFGDGRKRLVAAINCSDCQRCAIAARNCYGSVMQMFSKRFELENTYINQHLKLYPWQFKHCHGKLA
jgi:hypothetical protein